MHQRIIPMHFEKAPTFFFKSIILNSCDKSCHVVLICLIATVVLSVICICFTEENDISKRKKQSIVYGL